MPAIDTTTTVLDDHYDVVVVGARAAGAATAMQLARAGVRVAAIDKATYGSDTLSTHSIALAGVLLLSRWGVLDTIRQAGTPVGDRVVFHYGDDTVGIDIPTRGDVDGLYAPRRTLLDRALVDAAIEAGATVRHGTAVRGLVKNRGRVTGVEIDDHGTPRTITAGFVVGADGMNSRVARTVGATTLREERAGSSVIYAYFSGVADPKVVENDIRPGQAAGIIPTNNNEACVWIAGPGADFRSQVADGVETAFDRAVDRSPVLRQRLAGATAESRFRSFPGQPGFLRQAWGSGWALVGDSAYFKDPVSAHGITDALIGAELLTDALVEALNGTHDAAALARYQQQRDELAAPMIPAVATIASYDWDPAGVAGAYRDMSRAMRHEWDVLEARFAATALAA
ncbi:MAG: NAD(P)/FAD-dependent oxidoreductase [Acidimicrobiales bacterium]